MRSDGQNILVVRLGAMGDVLHALPAVMSLQRVTWMIKPQWLPLIEGNPVVERVLTAWPSRSFDIAYDFQGLIKSAVFARMGAPRVVGFTDPREAPARWLYSERRERKGSHVVEHNLALAGASSVLPIWLPPGRPEGKLPDGPFVLACPLAGWKSKQWPLEYYRQLRTMLDVPLVLNGPPGSGFDHESSLAGLIDATRRATAVLGVDSGPLHLAAALGKPGAAIYGPTCPARNGPFGGTMRVLRSPNARTSYKRTDEISEAMREITPLQVASALREAL